MEGGKALFMWLKAGLDVGRGDVPEAPKAC